MSEIVYQWVTLELTKEQEKKLKGTNGFIIWQKLFYVEDKSDVSSSYSFSPANKLTAIGCAFSSRKEANVVRWKMLAMTRINRFIEANEFALTETGGYQIQFSLVNKEYFITSNSDKLSIDIPLNRILWVQDADRVITTCKKDLDIVFGITPMPTDKEF